MAANEVHMNESEQKGNDCCLFFFFFFFVKCNTTSESKVKLFLDNSLHLQPSTHVTFNGKQKIDIFTVLYTDLSLLISS